MVRFRAHNAPRVTEVVHSKSLFTAKLAMSTRITIRRVGAVTGKKVALPASVAELLELATSKLELPSAAQRIFSEQGDEYDADAFELICMDEVLYVSSGEDFVAINNAGGGSNGGGGSNAGGGQPQEARAVRDLSSTARDLSLTFSGVLQEIRDHPARVAREQRLHLPATFASVMQQIRSTVCPPDNRVPLSPLQAPSRCDVETPPWIDRTLTPTTFDARANFPNFSVEIGGVVRFVTSVREGKGFVQVPEHDGIHVGDGLLVDFTERGVRKMPIGRSRYFPLEGKAEPRHKQNADLSMHYYRPFDDVLGQFAAEIAFAQVQLAVAPRPEEASRTDVPDSKRYLRFNRRKYDSWVDETDEEGASKAWASKMRMEKADAGKLRACASSGRRLDQPANAKRYTELVLSDAFEPRAWRHFWMALLLDGARAAANQATRRGSRPQPSPDACSPVACSPVACTLVCALLLHERHA